MPRTRPPNRMLSITQHVNCVLDGDHAVSPLVTFSIDRDTGRLMAIFCADFKAGTAMHSIVMDACVLMSRLLQHGVHPREIAEALAKPPSLIGALAEAADLLQRGSGAS